MEKHEFRALLVYLQRFFRLHAIFRDVDTGHDRKISITEFKAALPRLRAWGLGLDDATENDPESVFAEIDVNSSTQVEFDEFCKWALATVMAHEAEVRAVKEQEEAEAREEDERDSTDSMWVSEDDRIEESNRQQGLRDARAAARAIPWWERLEPSALPLRTLRLGNNGVGRETCDLLRAAAMPLQSIAELGLEGNHPDKVDSLGQKTKTEEKKKSFAVHDSLRRNSQYISARQLQSLAGGAKGGSKKRDDVYCLTHESQA